MSKNTTISKVQLDQLKEVMNIGASHASTALSRLIGERVLLTVPTALMSDIEADMAQLSGQLGSTEPIIAVASKTSGGLSGVVALFLSIETANKLANMAIKTGIGQESEESEQLTEFKYSAVHEVGNILCSSCLNALSKFFGLAIPQSLTNLATDSSQAITSSLLLEAGRDSGMILIFQVQFVIDRECFDASLVLFVDKESVDEACQLICLRAA